MKITREKFDEYLVQFAQQAMAPAAKARATKYAIGFAVGAGLVRLDDEMYAALLSAGIADDAGIDVDRLKTAVYKGVDMAGGMPLDKLKVVLDRPDVDRFFALVETGALS